MLRNFRLKSSVGRTRFIHVACCTLAGLVIPPGSLPARADVQVKGTSASVHVVAHNATVSEVLGALTETLKHIHCKEASNLDDVVNGSYKGSVEDVLGRILRGYDYIITNQGTAIDILVVGKSADAPAIVPALGAVGPVASAPASAAVALVPPAFAAPLPMRRSPMPARDQ